MKDYIEHYITDNECMDYSSQSAFFRDIDDYRFRILKKLLHSRTEKRILDIGSGNGRMNLSDSSSLFSLDISQTNNESSSIKAEGDINRLPYKERSFTSIVISQVLEHIVNPESAIREMNRILMDGGTLYITVPYNEIIKKHLCVHCNKLTPENAHLHSFNEKNMTDMLSAGDFEIKRIIKFENKILFSMHFFSIFRKLPIDLINFIDIIIGNWYNKYNKILFIAEKRASGSVGRAHPSQG